MKKTLISRLQCPECKNELVWKISKEKKDEVIEAEIKCQKCLRSYYVKGGIVDFINEKESTSESVTDNLKRFLKEHPAEEFQLFNSNEEDMKAADLWAKYLILKDKEMDDEAERILEIARKKMYTEESTNVLNSMLNKLVDVVGNGEEIVLDVASGYCNLAIKLLENTDRYIVATDNNINDLIASRKKVKELGIETRISFIACDMKKSPFKKDSFSMVTTLVGLQNISNPKDAIKEIRRICKGKFYTISTFCNEDDRVNLFVLKKDNLREVWIKREYERIFEENNWMIQTISNECANVSVPEYGDIIKWIRIDRFPIEETVFEYVLSVAR